VLLLAGSVLACGRGPSQADLEAAAEAFGTSGDVEDRGGHWTGIAEPPAFLDAAIDLAPGRPVSAIDRSAAFPVVLDLRLQARRWVPRAELDLDLLAQSTAGPSIWTLLDGDPVVVARSMSAEAATEGPVGDRSAPMPTLDEQRTEITARNPSSFVASDQLAALLDLEGAEISIIRADGDGMSTSVRPFTGKRLCAIGDLFGTVAVTASSEARGTGCDELWTIGDLGSADPATRVIGGLFSNVVGVGFADGLALVVTEAEPPGECAPERCWPGASLHGPDGVLVRDLGRISSFSQARAVVGAVAGVPVVFSAADAGEGVLFDAAEAAWVPMKPFPLNQEGIAEPTEIVFTDSHLVVAARNAVGLWAPAGAGSSWQKADLYTWPLYVATEDLCLNLRAQPSLTSAVIDCVDRGEMFFSDGAHTLADELRWVSVFLPGPRLRGWVAERFLSGVSPDDPSDYACA
jgi:hypothetical protein